MFLKALVVCEDARFEIAGTVTLVGVHCEVMAGVADHNGVTFPRLVVVAMLGGLAGVTEVKHRFALRALDAPRPPRDEPHESTKRNGAADEHVLVLSNAPMVFPAPGRYEVTVDVIAGGEHATYRYPFRVVV